MKPIAKAMSDTPRTNAVTINCESEPPTDDYVYADFAQSLERELSASKWNAMDLCRQRNILRDYIVQKHGQAEVVRIFSLHYGELDDRPTA